MLRLVVKDSSGERLFASERDEILIGRREDADLRLTDRACARNHCLLRVEGEKVRLVDLGSGSGVQLSGERVDQALLAPGEEFAVGGTTLRVAAFGGAAVPPPPPAGAAEPAAAAAMGPVPRGPQGDEFGREVRAMLAKTPWYMVSLVVHVVLLFLLDLIPYWEPPETSRTPLVSVPREELPEPEELAAKMPKLEDLKPELDPFEEDLVIDEPRSQAVEKNPLDAAEDEYEDLGPPLRLGIDRGRNKIVKLDSPLPVTKKKGADETLNKGDLTGEQGRARDEVVRDLGDGIAQARKKLGREHIIVIKGDFDKIEDVLDAYDYPYTLVEDRMDLVRRRYANAKIMFINCGRRPSKDQERKLVPELKSYVHRGCWLVTSDWAADPFLTGAFPDHVSVLRNHKRQPDTTVAVAPVSNDPLVKGIFPLRGETVWWLEETSTLIKVSDRVQMLIASEDMKKRFGSDVIAFSFEYGRGRVVHLLGHFYQKDGNRRGLVGMHRLINNVILECISPTH